ncbi:MAG: NUDIX domain-containing protein [Candidatus Woesearchaeota archaeon]
MEEIKLQVGVKALLKNKEGKYLLLKRNPEIYPDVKNNWDIVGGRINPGKSLFENLQREVYEETKLNLIKEPELIFAQDILIPNKHVVRLTFIGEIEGTPILDEEHLEYKWLTIEEMKLMSQLDNKLKEVLKEKF